MFSSHKQYNGKILKNNFSSKTTLFTFAGIIQHLLRTNHDEILFKSILIQSRLAAEILVNLNFLTIFT